jgi:hypothetical protein
MGEIVQGTECKVQSALLEEKTPDDQEAAEGSDAEFLAQLYRDYSHYGTYQKDYQQSIGVR